MESLLQAAYGAAKRVRTETKIGERPVSIAAAASQITRDLHGDLDRCRALLVGIGEMGELIVESLRSQGLQKLSIVAPRKAAAESMAKGFDCHVADFESLPELLIDADIVVTSLGIREPAIRAAEVEAAIKKRKQRPIFLIDAGIPGDIDPAVGKLENAFLYDLNDLEKVAMAGRAEREQAARAAHTLVDHEAAQFRRGRAERAAVPAIVALRSRFEAEAAKAGAEARGDGERATRLLVARLLHDPTEIMKELATGNHEDLRAAEAVLKHLFRLGDNKDRS
jgi:glutamyl-tRNA reductase